jgi:hypothetical protein
MSVCPKMDIRAPTVYGLEIAYVYALGHDPRWKDQFAYVA